MKPMDQEQCARHLRQCQNTYEAMLWQLLRNRRRCNKKFRRQHPIGIYTADFYCAEDVMRFTGKQVEAETDWVLAQIDQAFGIGSGDGWRHGFRT